MSVNIVALHSVANQLATTIVATISVIKKKKKQAWAELGQAQLKMGLDFNQIQYTFGFSLFDLAELVGWTLNFRID